MLGRKHGARRAPASVSTNATLKFEHAKAEDNWTVYPPEALALPKGGERRWKPDPVLYVLPLAKYMDENDGGHP